MWLVVLVGCRKGDEKFRKLLKANFADFTIVASPVEVNVIRSGKDLKLSKWAPEILKAFCPRRPADSDGEKWAMADFFIDSSRKG